MREHVVIEDGVEQTITADQAGILTEHDLIYKCDECTGPDTDATDWEVIYHVDPNTDTTDVDELIKKVNDA